jgi:dihydrofolate reductase
MKITLIAAMESMGGIGKNGELPWYIPADLQHFKEYTEGKVCVMGRKTWDSLPVKPLPGRYNWVLTESGGTKELIAMVDSNDNFMCSAMDYLLDMIRYNGINTDELCIIGGASIYEQFMPHATHMVLTHINGNYNCDTFFPEFNPSDWFAYEWKDIENGKVHYMERNNDI